MGVFDVRMKGIIVLNGGTVQTYRGMWENGKEHGNYYIDWGLGLGNRLQKG